MIEIRNRGNSGCELPPLSIGFPPDGPGLTDYKDTSKAAAEFKKKSGRLAPGEEAYILLAWSSVPVEYNGVVIGDCRTADTMTLYPTSDGSHPVLEVRHLWILGCDQMWRSSYRAGPYVPGEPVSDEWLQRVQLKDSDFTKSVVPEPARESADASAGAKFWTLLDVQYLRGSFNSGYIGAFPLFLKTSPEAPGNCPFRSLRKREADGQTTIYLSHCEAKSEPAGNNAGGKLVGFFDVDFGLAPERTGRVEYEATTEVHQGGKPTLGKAKLELFVRDPNRPMLPNILTSTPHCRVSQLKLISPEVTLGSHWDRALSYPPPGEDWYDAKVFELTNISDQSCMLGGVPALEFLRPTWWTSGFVRPPVCRNCATPLFKPRESRWIDLKPGDSAHLIAARAVSAYWPACTATSGIDMRLPGDTQALGLPFEANFCGEIPVTAWRAGRWDGDPMNVEFDRREDEREKEWLGRAPLGSSKVVCVDNTKPKSDLPPPGPQCAEREFARRGRPSMSAARDGVALGISSPPGTTTVYIWMDNRTDSPQGYAFICGSSFLAAIDVYDSGGHLLLSKGEETMQNTCAKGQPLLNVGSCSIGVTVAPHTMQVVDWGDLQDSHAGYALSAGHFFIVPSHVHRYTCESLNTTLEEAKQVKPTNAVMMVIPEK